MKTLHRDNKESSTFIKEFALKNYETYVSHYKSRNLKPMPFQDFLKNYTFRDN